MNEIDRQLGRLEEELNLRVTPKVHVYQRLLIWTGIFFGATVAALIVLQFVEMSSRLKERLRRSSDPLRNRTRKMTG